MPSTAADFKHQSRLSAFDYLVLLGGVINMVVISVIIFYWITS